MWDPRRELSCVCGGLKEGDGGDHEMKGWCETDGESVSHEEGRGGAEPYQPFGRDRGRENQHREKREQGGVPPGMGEVGRDIGGSISISQELLLCAVCNHFGRQLSLAVCLVEPALLHTHNCPLGCFICNYSRSIFMQWKEF